jgi:hypothetical protein
MRDAPIQANERFETDAADQSVQRAWDLFAASERSDEVEGEDREKGGSVEANRATRPYRGRRLIG